ncbi:MAG: sodium:solute symporter, partial [Deltaproteobacteria bacterium]|nr:sodium:solute symporter [Deltaproteobacteria bacterium]
MSAFTWYEYAIVGVYILFVLGIGAYFSKKGSANVEEYFLGGKTLPWWVLGISFMTSNLDLTGTMVIASFFAMAGLKGFLVELRGGTALPLAMFMIFMAKWHRRAGVMTVAEWMEFRFGKDKGARAARVVSAISVVVLVLGMMTYFVVGFGKFPSVYFPFSPSACAIVFTSIACLHILFSGLYGVAFTDVAQGVMILFTVIYITVLAFGTDIDPDKFAQAWDVLGNKSMTWDQWSTMQPSWTMDFPAGYEAYNAFGFLLIFWILRIFLEGFGGPLIPYASQRFFAARNDKDAALTTGSSLLFFVIRWPLIVGVAILGLSLGSAIPTDPEKIFPVVLGAYFPLGLRAVVVSCMVAAAISTFDSTVNAGGAYIVNDIYRRFIN